MSLSIDNMLCAVVAQYSPLHCRGVHFSTAGEHAVALRSAMGMPLCVDSCNFGVNLQLPSVSVCHYAARF